MKEKILIPAKNDECFVILETVAEEKDFLKSNREEDDARFEALHSMTEADLFRQLRHDVANVIEILDELAKLLKQVMERYGEDDQKDSPIAKAASNLHLSVCCAGHFLGKKLKAPDSKRLLDDANRDMSKKFEDLDDVHQTSYKAAFVDVWERERWFEHFPHDWRWHLAKFKRDHPNLE